MIKFNVQHRTDQPDRIFVALDDRFDVALIRTESGLSIEVYPITDGEPWTDPCDRFEVCESEILSLEQELRNE